jgi:hypothetical protein
LWRRSVGGCSASNDPDDDDTIGVAMHGIVDAQLEAAYSEAGNVTAAASVRDRQNRLERLRALLQAAGEQQQQSADPALTEVMAQGRPLPRGALIRHEMQEERLVREALKQTGFLPR